MAIPCLRRVRLMFGWIMLLPISNHSICDTCGLLTN